MARATSVDVLECPPCVIADGPRNLAAAGHVPEETGLVYVSDSEPGIRRQSVARGLSTECPTARRYRSVDQEPHSGAGLPPAYEDVWICLEERGHLQATGYDARGRKQYRYHREWQALRSADKFAQLVEFGKALPKIRRTIRRHMQGDVENMQTVLAALVALLDEAHLRTGNQAYVQANGSYGATTLLKRHLRLGDGFIELKFIGKGGKRVQRLLRRPKLQQLLEEIADLPGRQLFVWKDENDALRPVDSGRLNRYLTDMAGAAVSAKTFRTWGGTLAAFTAARTSIEQGEWPTIKQMSEAAASVLHNTPAISRSSYIHPDVLALADKSASISARQLQARGRLDSELRVEEQRLLSFLQRSARSRARQAKSVAEERRASS